MRTLMDGLIDIDERRESYLEIRRAVLERHNDLMRRLKDDRDTWSLGGFNDDRDIWGLEDPFEMYPRGYLMIRYKKNKEF